MMRLCALSVCIALMATSTIAVEQEVPNLEEEVRLFIK